MDTRTTSQTTTTPQLMRRGPKATIRHFLLWVEDRNQARTEMETGVGTVMALGGTITEGGSRMDTEAFRYLEWILLAVLVWFICVGIRYERVRCHL